MPTRNDRLTENDDKRRATMRTDYDHSEAWYEARRGSITASRVSDVLTKARGGKGLSVAATSYLYELIGEHLCGVDSPPPAWAMKWGIEHEPFARMEYEDATGTRVIESKEIYPDTEGVIHHESESWIAATPDGFIDNEGLLEIKCPATAKEFARFLESRTIPKEHFAQMQHQMFVTGAKFCDYAVYHPRAPKPLRLVVQRVEADYEEQVETVLAFRDEMVKRTLAIIENANERQLT